MTTTKTDCENPLPQLISLVEFSKRYPDKFDWKKNLNPWQTLFVDYIFQLDRNIPNLKLSPKQHDKAAECLARMTLI
jgi:hypothetical protein